MKNVDIPLNALTANGNNYNSPDGDLDVCANMINEGDGLKPICIPPVVMKMEDGQTLHFLHRNADADVPYEHYVYRNDLDGSWHWRNLDGSINADLPMTADKVNMFTAVGNTLMAVLDSRTLYLLYQPTTGGYKYLGDHIPDLAISFGLVGHPRLYSVFAEEVDEGGKDSTALPDGRHARIYGMRCNIENDEVHKCSLNGVNDGWKKSKNGKNNHIKNAWYCDEDKITAPFPDHIAEAVTNDIMGSVNKFTAKMGDENGRFVNPFFVRYALRMYDGTLINHSIPVLMSPCTAPPPIWGYEPRGKKNADHFNCDMMLVACDLDMRVIANGAREALKDWKDLIISLDIYASRQIYPYRTDTNIKRFRPLADAWKAHFLGRLAVSNSDDEVIDNGTVYGCVLSYAGECSWFGGGDFTVLQDKIDDEQRKQDEEQRKQEEAEAEGGESTDEAEDTEQEPDADDIEEEVFEDKPDEARDQVNTRYKKDGWVPDALLYPFNSTEFKDKYCEWSYEDIYKMYFAGTPAVAYDVDSREEKSLIIGDRLLRGKYSVELPVLSEVEFAAELKKNNTFFLLKSIPLGQIPEADGQRRVIKFEDDELWSLAADESMEGEYRSHDKRGALQALNINHRLHLAGVRRELFRGFPPAACLPYINDRCYVQALTKRRYMGIMHVTPLGFFGPIGAEYTIRHGGMEYKVLSGNAGMAIAPPFSPCVKVRKADGTTGVVEWLPTCYGRWMFHNDPECVKVRFGCDALTPKELTTLPDIKDWAERPLLTWPTDSGTGGVGQEDGHWNMWLAPGARPDGSDVVRPEAVPADREPTRGEMEDSSLRKDPSYEPETPNLGSYWMDEEDAIFNDDEKGFYACVKGATVWDMKPSEALFGAVRCRSDRQVRKPVEWGISYFDKVWESKAPVLSDMSMLCVSESGNPFAFLADSQITVGRGTLMAIAMGGMALSEGQFGEYPVYAFTDEGVWALAMTGDGRYGNGKPLNMDVLDPSGGEPIVSVDGSVMFPTQAGIVELGGGKRGSLTAMIDTTVPFDASVLRDVQALDKGGERQWCRRREWIEDLLCHYRMMYDYTHQRLWLFSTRREHAYVYSMKGRGWGEVPDFGYKSAVNAWPRAFVQKLDGTVVNLSARSHEPMSPCVGITRPIKFGAADVHKSIGEVLMRGFGAEKVMRGMILYGSQDGQSWKVVRSCRGSKMRGFGGSGYKFFRLAFAADMDEEARLTHLNIGITGKLNNKQR